MNPRFVFFLTPYINFQIHQISTLTPNILNIKYTKLEFIYQIFSKEVKVFFSDVKLA